MKLIFTTFLIIFLNIPLVFADDEDEKDVAEMDEEEIMCLPPVYTGELEIIIKPKIYDPLLGIEGYESSNVWLYKGGVIPPNPFCSKEYLTKELWLTENC